jgi:acyl-CoA dehydrogenase
MGQVAAGALDPGPSAEEEDAILDGLFSFIDRRIVPMQEKLRAYFEDSRLYFDESGHEAQAIADARRQVRIESAEAGYYNLFTPVELGGSGLSKRFMVRVTEAVSRRYGPGEPREHLATGVVPDVFVGPGPIWLQAQPELREELAPKLLSGEIRSSFALSEPDAGSDNWNMRTTAVRADDGTGDWVINGQKQWTSWVKEADFLFVFAVPDPGLRDAHQGGITCFYVPTDTPGYELSSVVRLFNDPGGREGILSFTDVRVPDAWRIGEVDQGFKAAFLTLGTTRLWLAARCLGEAYWAYDRCLEYAKTRRTFGRPIAEHQLIQGLLADMAVDLYSGHAVTMDCAARADAGMDVRAETAMVKYHGTNAANRVFDKAIQIHGGMGFATETKLTDGWRFTRICRMTEGSDQIMQRSIAAQMLKGGLPDWGGHVPGAL